MRPIPSHEIKGPSVAGVGSGGSCTFESLCLSFYGSKMKVGGGFAKVKKMVNWSVKQDGR